MDGEAHLFFGVMNFTRAEERERDQDREAWLVVTTGEPKKNLLLQSRCRISSNEK
jgi:hypothetical protein